jgi:hypothetical protein
MNAFCRVAPSLRFLSDCDAPGSAPATAYHVHLQRPLGPALALVRSACASGNSRRLSTDRNLSAPALALFFPGRTRASRFERKVGTKVNDHTSRFDGPTSAVQENGT